MTSRSDDAILADWNERYTPNGHLSNKGARVLGDVPDLLARAVAAEARGAELEGEVNAEVGWRLRIEKQLAEARARVAELAGEERLKVLTEVENVLAGIASPNCELRYDGTEDPTTAAWVEGLRDAHNAVVNLRSAALATPG